MIEMRQVDAGREQAPAAVFRVLDRVAAQHGDIGRRIERGDVDRDFKPVERRLVFGIEKARVAHGDQRRLAAPLQRRAFELESCRVWRSGGLVPALPAAATAWRGTDACRTPHARGRARETDLDRSRRRLCRAVASAFSRASCASSGTRPGTAAAASRTRCLDALELREIAGQAAIKRSRHERRETFRAPRGRAARIAAAAAASAVRARRLRAADDRSSSAPMRHCREKFSASRR